MLPKVPKECGFINQKLLAAYARAWRDVFHACQQLQDMVNL